MRFVFTLIAGIVVGYNLHSKKDQTIDQVANGAVTFLERRSDSVRSRFVTAN